MMFPESWSIEQILIQSGRGDGARFMKKNGAVGAVGITLHHHRAIPQVREEHGRDVGVVLQEVAFGEAELGPENLAEVRQANLFPSTRSTTLS